MWYIDEKVNRAAFLMGQTIDERLMGKKAIKSGHLNSLTSLSITKTKTPRGTLPAERMRYKRCVTTYQV